MKQNALLEVKNLHVSAEDETEILHGVNLTLGRDETHVLMGPNGTGKSTLGYAITGNPNYTVTEGKIIFDGEDITDLPVNERAKKGIFLSFQNPLEVPGVTLSAFIRTSLEQKTGSRLRLWDFKKKLAETMKLLNMDESLCRARPERGLLRRRKEKGRNSANAHAGAQAGHSGRDGLRPGRGRGAHCVQGRAAVYRSGCHGSLLIITHSTRILEALQVDADPRDGKRRHRQRTASATLVEEINEQGFRTV